MCLHPDVIDALAGVRPTFLYLAEVLTFGKSNPIKIGVTFNPEKRMHGLAQLGITRPLLLGWFCFEDRIEALRIEHAACRHFPKSPRHAITCPREVLDASLDELLAFIGPRSGGRQFIRA